MNVYLYKGEVKMLETIGLILDLILAVIGTFIAVMQFRNESRERKKQKELEAKNREEKDIIANIVNSRNSVDAAFEAVVESYLGIETNRTNGFEVVQQLVENVPKLLTACDKMNDDILKLYRQLLINEDRFSLSYGFGRYIDVFRKNVFIGERVDSKLVNVLAEYNNLIGYIQRVQSGEEEETPEKSAKYTNALVQALHPVYMHVQNVRNEISPYMSEMKLKYGELEKK